MLSLLLSLALTAPEPPRPESAQVAPTVHPTAPPSPTAGKQDAELMARHLWLQAYDKDGDHRLSKSELPLRLAKKFDKADVNGDGFIDGHELLIGKTRMSVQARKAENLKMSSGRLAPRGRAGEIALTAALQVLLEIDTDGDGILTTAELDAAMKQPGRFLPMLTSLIADAAGGGVPIPGKTQLNATPAAASANSNSTAADEIGPDGLPTPAAIMKNLDRDKNGLLDQTEAVDRLAQNFKLLDRDKDGFLSQGEIERGLKLAKMLGLRPQVNPEVYRARPATDAKPASDARPLPDDKPTTPRKKGYL